MTDLHPGILRDARVTETGAAADKNLVSLEFDAVSVSGQLILEMPAAEQQTAKGPLLSGIEIRRE